MSWDEVRTRLSQAASKRLDLLRYRLGRGFANGKLETSTRRGEFFFDADQLAGRIELVQKLVPGETTRIRDEADRICQHRFNLLGYTGLDYGREIDWHLDAVHGKRAPLKPWFKIDFLDFSAVGDHKIIWELNRHQHLVTLAKAWALTSENRYLEELVGQWYSWQRANPYPLGINWGSALEVAFRSLSWLWVEKVLDDRAPLPPTFRADLTRGLLRNGGYIEKYLSVYFSPNTHLLGEAVALFFIGTLCPQQTGAERWKERGWKIILDAAKRQVRADGVYFEQALHYHVYALDFFLHSRILASRNGIEIPAEFDRTLEKMLDVLEAVSQSGPPEGFGDDDGGRVFDPRRNRTEHMTDPLAIGAAIYGRAVAELTEESIWLLGERSVPAVQARPAREIRSNAFPAGGVYVMAGNTPCPHQIVIDGGPQGVGRCGHGHADALSLRMAMDGRRVLVDPGTSTYISDSNERDIFRGTGAHNTVRVDEQDQALVAGPFAWTAIPKTQVERWVSGDGFDFLVARHDGYSRLPSPVLHRRFVFRGPDGICLIRDVCEGQGRHLIESFWHFAEDIQVTNREPGFIVSYPDHFTVAMPVAGSCDWHGETGSGLVSPAYGARHAAPMARISASPELPAECAVLMIAGDGAQGLGALNYASDSKNSALRLYQYKTRDAIHKFIFTEGGRQWTAGEWTSDAAFLYCVSSFMRAAGSEDQLLRVVMVAGSFATRWDKKIVSRDRAVEHWQWSDRDRKSSVGNPALEFADR
jgi:hypothetical protein